MAYVWNGISPPYFSRRFFQNQSKVNISYIKMIGKISSNFVVKKFLESDHPVKSYGCSKMPAMPKMRVRDFRISSNLRQKFFHDIFYIKIHLGTATNLNLQKLLESDHLVKSNCCSKMLGMPKMRIRGFRISSNLRQNFFMTYFITKYI